MLILLRTNRRRRTGPSSAAAAASERGGIGGSLGREGPAQLVSLAAAPPVPPPPPRDRSDAALTRTRLAVLGEAEDDEGERGGGGAFSSKKVPCWAGSCWSIPPPPDPAQPLSELEPASLMGWTESRLLKLPAVLPLCINEMLLAIETSEDLKVHAHAQLSVVNCCLVVDVDTGYRACTFQIQMY